MTESQIFVGLGLTVLLAVACQILAARFRVPAIVLLLPVGFVAGSHVAGMNPLETLGDAFTPLVNLGVAIILFDGGLDLVFSELEGHHQRVVRRLLYLGVPITWGVAGLLAAPLLGLSGEAAVMLGAILIVSGPTVVAPLLEAARPGRRVALILGWEGTTIDPIGAIIGALVFQGISHHVSIGGVAAVGAFGRSVGVGLLGGAAGVALLWLLLGRLRLRGVLATEAIVAVVIGIAALCDAVRADTGLIAAITMGVAAANLKAVGLPEDRDFFRTVVQLVIGLLFISISAAVSTTTVSAVLWPTLALVAGLVLVARPLVAGLATAGSALSARERLFVGWMDPRGIVAASTAAAFTTPLVQAGVEGADKLLPATFLVIIATVTLYGLTASPVARLLRLGDDAPDEAVTDDGSGVPPDEPTVAPPVSDEAG